MSRPSDWFLVELPGDPVPGDAFGIRSLSAKYAEISRIAGEASTGVRNARSSGAAAAWVGDAGDVFRDKSERMPGELAKANDSYEIVADALKTWADAVDDTQAQADRGLQQAREAQADLSAAQQALGAAQHSWSTVHAQQLTYQKLVKDYRDVPPPSNVTMPTDYQLRSTDRNAQQAQTSIASAQHAISDAESRLAAAKQLVLEAKSRRDDAEQAAVRRIGEAGDRAVKPSSIWEAIQDSAAWQTFVTIATVVLTIVSIVAIFVGGPIVWGIILAATAILMVNALMSIAQGKNAWGELAMLAIGIIPGGRLLALGATAAHAATAAMAVTRVGARIIPAVVRAGDAVTRVASGVRTGLGALKQVVVPFLRGPSREGFDWIVNVGVHAVKGGRFTDEGNLIVHHWSPLEEGPLGALDKFPTDTFRSSTYDEVLVTHGTQLNRTVADGGRIDGGFWSHQEPGGHLSSQFDFALKPEWNMTNPTDLAAVHQPIAQATHIVQMEVPRGTTIFEGAAGPQASTGAGRLVNGSVSNVFAGSLPGGAQQVYIEQAVMRDLVGAGVPIHFPVPIAEFLSRL